jgi:CMP-N,N'-diacetyllegionaminic acid synthase
MIIRVDIDETICEYEGNREYPLAKPIQERIEKVNKLYDDGHTIVYWTARGSVTKKDWAELTVTQLKEWGAKYHKVELGKPHYDLYIDDKSINSELYFGIQEGETE